MTVVVSIKGPVCALAKRPLFTISSFVIKCSGLRFSLLDLYLLVSHGLTDGWDRRVGVLVETVWGGGGLQDTVRGEAISKDGKHI